MAQVINETYIPICIHLTTWATARVLFEVET